MKNQPNSNQNTMYLHRSSKIPLIFLSHKVLLIRQVFFAIFGCFSVTKNTSFPAAGVITPHFLTRRPIKDLLRAKFPLSFHGSSAISPPEWAFSGYFYTQNPTKLILAGFLKNKAKKNKITQEGGFRHHSAHESCRRSEQRPLQYTQYGD